MFLEASPKQYPSCTCLITVNVKMNTYKNTGGFSFAFFLFLSFISFYFPSFFFCIVLCCLKGTCKEDFTESFSLESERVELYLALAQDAGFRRTLPFEGAVIGISFIGTT